MDPQLGDLDDWLFDHYSPCVFAEREYIKWLCVFKMIPITGIRAGDFHRS